MKLVDRAWRGARSEWKMHTVSAVGSAVAFLCLAFALIALTNIHQVKKRWESAGRVSAYLVPGVEAARVDVLADVLSKTPGIRAARYMSAKASRDALVSADAQETLLARLPKEAYPESFEVYFEEGISKKRSQAVVSTLVQLEEVESLETYGSWTARVARFVDAAMMVTLLLSLVVFFAVATMVSSSTKLMLERRREEVEVLRVVGATKGYVRQPFMVEGAVQGAAGALVALCLAGAIFAFLTRRFDEHLTVLLGVAPMFLPWFVCIALVLLGALLGAAASLFSLRRSFSV